MFADCVYKLFQTQVHGRGRAVALCIALWTCIELWMMFGDCVYELFQTQVHDVGGLGGTLAGSFNSLCVSSVGGATPGPDCVYELFQTPKT